MPGYYAGKTVLITGGTGSIGSIIAEHVLSLMPKQLRIYSRDETKQHELAEKLSGDHAYGDKIAETCIAHKQYIMEETRSVRFTINDFFDRARFLIGDVRDYERLCLAMRGVDVVFHCAAMKHVSSCEYNPFEAVQTNVGGTQNVINAAVRNKVGRVVAISTDKAVNPVNVMGATKLLAEKLITSANNWTKDGLFACIRLGNVLGSRGSLVPVVVERIRRGLPIHITDKNMTRYFVTPRDVAVKCLALGAYMTPGQVLVPQLKSARIIDVIDALVRKYGPAEIVEVGMKPGEKMHEQLKPDGPFSNEVPLMTVDEIDSMLSEPSISE